jgi:phage FluMu protein Com
MSWRSRLEDKYTVICRKCKKELIDTSKTPNQKYYKGKCPHCNNP